MEAERVELLSVVEDHYGGVVVSLENQEPVDSELFFNEHIGSFNEQLEATGKLIHNIFNPIEAVHIFCYLQ
ncbi:hypothetical protein VIGAN_04269900 [Vigna angularis var. angularis]|uniref:Uncharacterized protein n=1 Tax=Vigna angularis var. angularis TaxID=157739 RepID=A0A0S3RX62_PHAAN|nr:hypothetical protein VIGAN_04269900 [Vigna angularis var. angularis]